MSIVQRCRCYRAPTSRALVCGSAIAALVGAPLAPAAGAPSNARISGRVLVCNVPNHCLTREFTVSAVTLAGHTVARTRTTGADNKYLLKVAAGSYELVARSSGLVCRAAATAAAHETTRQNITCPVP